MSKSDYPMIDPKVTRLCYLFNLFAGLTALIWIIGAIFFNWSWIWAITLLIAPCFISIAIMFASGLIRSRTFIAKLPSDDQ